MQELRVPTEPMFEGRIAHERRACYDLICACRRVRSLEPGKRELSGRAADELERSNCRFVRDNPDAARSVVSVAPRLGAYCRGAPWFSAIGAEHLSLAITVQPDQQEAQLAARSRPSTRAGRSRCPRLATVRARREGHVTRCSGDVRQQCVDRDERRRRRCSRSAPTMYDHLSIGAPRFSTFMSNFVAKSPKSVDHEISIPEASPAWNEFRRARGADSSTLKSESDVQKMSDDASVVALFRISVTKRTIALIDVRGRACRAPVTLDSSALCANPSRASARKHNGTNEIGELA